MPVKTIPRKNCILEQSRKVVKTSLHTDYKPYQAATLFPRQPGCINVARGGS